MEWVVYRTRHAGAKLPNQEAVRYGRRVGNLVYRERLWDPRPGRGIWLATLTRPDGQTYVIPPLDRARIRRIRGGVLIHGLEVIARNRASKNIKADRYPQTWWCVPLAWDDHQPVEASPRQRAEVLGLDPKDDDEPLELAGQKT